MKNKLVAFITPTSFLDVKFYFLGVAVPPGNKYHGRNINDMEYFDVHGGITLSEPATYPDVMNGMEIKKEYVGKRNKLLEKAEFITDNTGIGDDWWIFGFDTVHWGNNKYNWDRQALIEETLSMMEQLNCE